MALTKGFDFPNKIKFLQDFIEGSLPYRSPNQSSIISFSSVNFRLILYPIHLLKIIIIKKDQLLNANQL
jgi:hypothetical protein